MAGAIDTQNKRGSIWHRWDPHIHTPGTALNNQYTGTDPWESFLRAIEASDPPIRALGITDYFGIERYEQVVEQQRQGRLANVGLIFPNVELRLSIETSKASAVNIHRLFSPEDSDHVEQIKRFLLELDFSYQGGPYRCQRSDLIRLGRAHQPSLTDDDAARSEGANQFKVKLDQLTEAWARNNWVKKNALIAVAGGEKDGTSGLSDASASFAASRKHVEGIANIVFIPADRKSQKMLTLNLKAVLSSWHLPKDRKLHKLRKKYKFNRMAALQLVIYNAVLVQSPWTS